MGHYQFSSSSARSTFFYPIIVSVLRFVRHVALVFFVWPKVDEVGVTGVATASTGPTEQMADYLWRDERMFGLHHQRVFELAYKHLQGRIAFIFNPLHHDS